MPRQKTYKAIAFREFIDKTDHTRVMPGDIVTGTRARMMELKDYARCTDIDYDETDVKVDVEVEEAESVADDTEMSDDDEEGNVEAE